MALINITIPGFKIPKTSLIIQRLKDFHVDLRGGFLHRRTMKSNASFGPYIVPRFMNASVLPHTNRASLSKTLTKTGF